MLQRILLFLKSSINHSRKERFEEICKKAEKHAKEIKIKEEDVDRLIHEYRKEKQNTKIE